MTAESGTLVNTIACWRCSTRTTALGQNSTIVLSEAPEGARGSVSTASCVHVQLCILCAFHTRAPIKNVEANCTSYSVCARDSYWQLCVVITMQQRYPLCDMKCALVFIQFEKEICTQKLITCVFQSRCGHPRIFPDDFVHSIHDKYILDLCLVTLEKRLDIPSDGYFPAYQIVCITPLYFIRENLMHCKDLRRIRHVAKRGLKHFLWGC